MKLNTVVMLKKYEVKCSCDTEKKMVIILLGNQNRIKKISDIFPRSVTK